MHFDHYIDRRLEEWAKWFIKGKNIGKGYPSTSSFVLCQNGLSMNGKKNRYPTPLSANDAAEEIEHYVSHLFHYYESMANVLRKNYLGEEITLRKKAISLGLSETTYRFYLQMAKMWVGGCLSVKFRKIKL